MNTVTIQRRVTAAHIIGLLRAGLRGDAAAQDQILSELNEVWPPKKKAIRFALRSLVVQRIPNYVEIPRWMAVAYFDYCRAEAVCVPVGIHLLVSLAWRVNFKYCRWKNQPSWIDHQLSREKFSNRPAEYFDPYKS